jgi:hypothetical protein
VVRAREVDVNGAGLRVGGGGGEGSHYFWRELVGAVGACRAGREGHGGGETL